MQLTIVAAALFAASRALAAPLAAPADASADTEGWTTVSLYEHKDFKGRSSITRHSGGSVYAPCNPVADYLRNRVTSYKVNNGDCEFYGDDYCDPYALMFRAVNRSDKKLRPGHNDVMRSFICR